LAVGFEPLETDLRDDFQILIGNEARLFRTFQKLGPAGEA
jgi:hypothetical protein